ncbi:cation-transporting ATPase E [Arthrobacter ginsengisoli]|uniref:Cation-transporting ATPase E n=2 Tax=Arthrobacter ginsengisoli TaxID=1356565 RepID=A0ABU1UIW7_9MICC|nr:HAD-IC family P-type ATPase [Arthrobacter ginsengisoli]MDR7085141.1 cation-transporting ATPase E [Arthrobacter ginsengisoli]
MSGPPAGGLSRGDVASRMRHGLANQAPDATSRSLWEIVRANVLTLFNAIVGTSFVLLLLLGSWQDALFGLSAVGNSVIGVVQEYRAKVSLDRLAVLEAPRARVLRDGTVQEIATADVVLDDVLVLRAGDQVTADAAVLESGGLEADESLLTGESDPVDREVGSEVLSGSIIVAGRGTARVVRVGAESFASRLTADAKRFSLVNSEIRNSLDRILRWLTWALLPVALIVANGEMQSRGGWEQAIASGAWTSALVGVIASVIAMIPLGLVLLSSVAFAVGGVRLAGNKVLIQELAAVEGLARVDVLCLDKTGTLTEGQIVFDGVHELAEPAEPGWEHALGWFAADPEANATSRCLEAAFGHNGGNPAVSSVPFSSARKWSSVTFDGGSQRRGSWILGAPEVVLTERSGAGAVAGSPAGVALGKAGQLAASGLRTVVLAYAGDTAIAADKATLPSDVKPVVVLTFREQIRPDARQTLAYFREEGVALKIISGDDPRTVAAIARSVGLDVVDGYDARTLPADPRLLEEVMATYMVFGRVSPDQKKDMVAALQRRGHTVAMTGDGVNDVLALKEADLGIAMNSAAAATKAVARLVLLDGRFDRLPGVLAEGRRVIANIERVSKLFLSKTAYSIAIAVSFGLLNLQFPFLPRQLSFTDGLTIGIPAFFLALMANARPYRPGFLRRSLSFAMPAGLIVAASLLGLNVYANSSGSAAASPEALQSASVLTLALLGLWILSVVSRPLDAKKLAVLIAMCTALLVLLNLPLAQEFLKLTLPPADMLWAAGAAVVGGGLVLEVLAWVHGRKFPR